MTQWLHNFLEELFQLTELSNMAGVLTFFQQLAARANATVENILAWYYPLVLPLTQPLAMVAQLENPEDLGVGL